MACQESHSVLGHSFSGLLAWLCSAPPGWGLKERSVLVQTLQSSSSRGILLMNRKKNAIKGAPFKYLTWALCWQGQRSKGCRNRTRSTPLASEGLGFHLWPTPCYWG